MNSISWFLYFADLTSNLSSAAAVVCFLSVMALFATIFFRAFTAIKCDPAEPKEAGATLLSVRLLRANIVTLAVAAVLIVVIPSKNTMYAIAASEVGERVVKSEAVQGIATDATKALHQWIRRQIEPEASSKK